MQAATMPLGRDGPLGRPLRVTARPATRPHAAPPSSAHPLAPILTLVLWSGCVAVGAVGFAFPYSGPAAAIPEPAPLTVEKLAVELTGEPLPPPASAGAPAAPPAPPPEAPPLAAAAPAPALAFPLPVAGPVRMVDAARASSSRAAPAAAAVPASVQPLVFGRGEGRQPAPGYPSAAIRDGQEGTVTIRFDINADGQVTAADVSAPSPWPLLNEAALRVIRERWRFSPGASRTYEVAIRFSLQK